MRFIKVLFIICIAGLVTGVLLASVFGQAIVADIQQSISETTAGKFFDLVGKRVESMP